MVSYKKQFLASLMVLAVSLFMANTVLAKTTSDPNHKGWSGKHPRTNQVSWKPIKTKCDKCQKLTDQYNQTMSQLLISRYWVHFWREVDTNREKLKKNPFWKGKGDISEFEAQAVGANLELFEYQQAQLELHRKLVYQLERHAFYLRNAIKQCEATQCAKSKPTKIKQIAMGETVTPQSYEVDYEALFQKYSLDWRGPYATKCQPCLPIVAQLNAVPGWLARTDMELQIAEAMLEYSKLIKKSNKITVGYLKYVHPDLNDYSHLPEEIARLKAELSALVNYFKKLVKDLKVCEKKYCPKQKDKKVSTDNVGYFPLEDEYNNCPINDASQTIVVGDNKQVGSSANFKEKAKKRATGMAANALGNLLGVGGGGRKGKSDGPATEKDPIKSKRKLRVRDKQAKRDLETGAIFTQDGLLVSTNIRKAPGKGTFQSIELENQRGWRLQPIALFMYEIWRDWKLNVSWTRDTYVNGQHVKHEQGGWTESWREIIAQGEETIYGEVPQAPIWQQLGFNTAVSGARSVGTLFPVNAEMLASEPVSLVIHVTQPKSDPVTTVPYLFTLSLGDDGNIEITESKESVAEQKAQEKDPCEKNRSSQDSDHSTPSGSPQSDQDAGQAPENNNSNNNGRTADQDDTSGQADDGKDLKQDKDNRSNKDNKAGKDDGPRGDPRAASAGKAKDPCKDDCAKLKKAAEDAAQKAKDAQSKADQSKSAADTADTAAKDAEKAADDAEEMAKDDVRDDHAIINDDKYTTADTEYRIMLQGEINAKHQAGEISNAEHEQQTKANTVKKAQQERLKNLAKLKAAAKKARAAANDARAKADKAKTQADADQKAANDAKTAAEAAEQAYKDCLKKAKEECDKIKAAEAKRLADIKAAEDKRIADAKAAAERKKKEEERRIAAEKKRQERIAENKRLMELIKELGLIDKKISDAPSLWQWLPDILEQPIGMFAEQVAAVPVPTDTIKALAGLYGLAGAMLNPCTKAGIEKTEARLRKMINKKTGKLYTESEAAMETAAMCRLMGAIRGRIAAAKNAQSR